MPNVVARLGVLGDRWRADAYDDGSVALPDGTMLAWAIVAEDRVHVPAGSSTLRWRRIDGVPVVEYALRVPGGDVAVAAFAVAGAFEGALVVDVDNRSGASVAFACSHRHAFVGGRSAAPPAGAGLPPGWGVHPLAHGSSLRLALGDGTALDAHAVASLPGAAAVVNGWRRHLAGGLHVELPDADIEDRLRSARADACLGDLPDPRLEPEEHLWCVAQRTTLGLRDAVEPADVAEAATIVAAQARRASTTPWSSAAAIVAAVDVLAALHDERAVRDACALATRLPAAEAPPELAPADHRAYEAWLAARLAVADRTTVRLLPSFPDAWRGANLAAYHVPTLAGAVGFAVRWHATRPALLWEVPLGTIVTCPGLDPRWSSTEPRGEALLAEPQR